jgi:hypothetical protein
VNGPLTADQLIAILQSFRSVHQFQQYDQFSVVYISEQLTLQLDRGAMESIVEYLEGGNNQCRRTHWLRTLTEKLTVRPRLEPEVLEAMSRAPEPEPDPPFDLEKPKFIARVRFNLLNGRRREESHAISRLAELDHLLDDGPYDEDIKNIKIRLEIQS